MKVLSMIAGFVFLFLNLCAFAEPAGQAVEPKQKLVEKLNMEWVGQGKLTKGAVSPLTSLQATVTGTFWRNPKWIETLGLSADQQGKMDDIFQQYRIRLIDLTATLHKEELILEPLFGNSRPAPGAEAKILTQIDRIADARAELEKANSRMLVNILQVLTTEQWSKLPPSAFRSKKTW